MRRKRSRWPETEVELAAPVVAWLRLLGWEVYQEVPIGSGAADIVATCGPQIWIVETKLHLNLDLLSQAFDHLGRAHRISVAVPRRRRRFSAKFVRTTCAGLGLGLIEVSGEGGNSAHVEEVEAGLFLRHAAAHETRRCLYEEQKTFAPAGSAAASRWTPFAATCAELRNVVTAKPGIEIKTAIESIRHHYISPTSARAALVKLIERDVVAGVRIERDGRVLKLFPAG